MKNGKQIRIFLSLCVSTVILELFDDSFLKKWRKIIQINRIDYKTASKIVIPNIKGLTHHSLNFNVSIPYKNSVIELYDLYLNLIENGQTNI